MAKKVKQRKAGVTKRKQQKRHKRTLLKRKSSSRPPQQIRSQKDLQKILATLPHLAFEKEMENLRFNKTELEEMKGKNLPEPGIIMKLLTPEFVTDIQERLAILEKGSAPQSPQNMLAKATLYSIENSEEMPLFTNPLIIAIYLKTRAEVMGEELTVNGIGAAIDEFEEQYHELIEEIVTDPEALQRLDQLMEESPDSTTVESESIIDSSVMNEFMDTLSGLSDEEQERVEVDVEVFIEDYLQAPPEEWNKNLMDDFLGNWFIPKLNPLEDDLVSMQDSLIKFCEFLAQKEVLTQNALNEILPVLKDQTTYKQRLANG